MTNIAPETGECQETSPEEREKTNSIGRHKSGETVTVIFTWLNGSSMIAEHQRRTASPMLSQPDSAIIQAAINENHGHPIKLTGNESAAFFDDALDAVRAAARIQRQFDALNMSSKFTLPILARIGMHTGRRRTDKMDIYSDVMSTAAFLQSAADNGGILISEDSYDALSDKSAIHCRFVRQLTLKGKQVQYNLYKVFWNPLEIELDRPGKNLIQQQ